MRARVAEDWRRHGACLDVDPEIFFPIALGAAASPQVEAAKAVCRRCPVTEQCLDWALGVRELEGVWGATAPAERLSMLRERRPQVSEV